ncbi:MAG: hypothetical protein CO096_06855 [Armatimonadetes bacterium CG_4_9_14_3_um_filter_66_14]|nr:MAG: hypothetical protein COS65_19285 [Armatimonadetes bacterium CG06_land_8_20_14_3_00_66_21]PIX37191.1 MAG: hypothetical protein COZ57_35620 [Armatimonadetes bacterium CG_4_8_14_3_um_filter_66_20]PJB72922.1 MAG: hypothetical protein CO096_06855 [Armatimonadetes bacterium CG_4_9_14_3_um_filter_66_14]
MEADGGLAGVVVGGSGGAFLLGGVGFGCFDGGYVCLDAAWVIAGIGSHVAASVTIPQAMFSSLTRPRG